MKLIYKFKVRPRFSIAAFFGIQNEYTTLKGFPLQSSLNFVAHVPYYELLYAEEDSIVKKSVKTPLRASILQFSN